jgi:hypothetical protein
MLIDLKTFNWLLIFHWFASQFITFSFVLLFAMTRVIYASVRYEPNGFIGTPSPSFRFLRAALHFIQHE